MHRTDSEINILIVPLCRLSLNNSTLWFILFSAVRVLIKTVTLMTCVWFSESDIDQRGAGRLWGTTLRLLLEPSPLWQSLTLSHGQYAAVWRDSRDWRVIDFVLVQPPFFSVCLVLNIFVFRMSNYDKNFFVFNLMRDELYHKKEKIRGNLFIYLFLSLNFTKISFSRIIFFYFQRFLSSENIFFHLVSQKTWKNIPKIKKNSQKKEKKPKSFVSSETFFSTYKNE